MAGDAHLRRAFLLVLVLQYTQNRDTRAIQLKLDAEAPSCGAVSARACFLRASEMTGRSEWNSPGGFEPIRSLDRARTQLVRLEQLSDEELAEIESEFQELRREQGG